MYYSLEVTCTTLQATTAYQDKLVLWLTTSLFPRCTVQGELFVFGKK